MKNLIILFLCLILALSFSSCGAVETNDENNNRKAREDLQKVLSEEDNFTYKCMVFGKVTEEIVLEKVELNNSNNELHDEVQNHLKDLEEEQKHNTDEINN